MTKTVTVMELHQPELFRLERADVRAEVRRLGVALRRAKAKR